MSILAKVTLCILSLKTKDTSASSWLLTLYLILLHGIKMKIIAAVIVYRRALKFLFLEFGA